MRLLLTILLLFSCILPAITQSPGGVADPASWQKGEPIDAAARWTEKISREMWWNGWPVLQLSGNQPVMLPQKPVTLFTVFRPEDGSVEEVVFSVTERDTLAFILTNRRLANLQDTTYLNLPTAFWRKPGITAWMHSFAGRDAARLNVLNAGAVPLPVISGQGQIAEIVLYARFLSIEEQARVYTYLALKYGVDLARGQDYLSPKGEVLWSARRDSAYAHRITGIGRSEATSWHQHQSRFQADEAGVQLGIAPLDQPNGQATDQLPDESYLLLGDNAAPWVWEPDTMIPERALLQRQWRVRTHRFPDTVAMSFRFYDPARWLLFPAETTVVLEVDRSGTGTFSPRQTDQYTTNIDHRKGYLEFSGITWDSNGSGKDQIRLVTPAAVAPQPLSTGLSVYPNPTAINTPIQLFWQMEKEPNAPVTLQLVDANGRVLRHIEHPPARFIRHSLTLEQAGTYWLIGRAGQEIVSTKIIAQ